VPVETLSAIGARRKELFHVVLCFDGFGFEPNERSEDAMMLDCCERLLSILFGAGDAAAFALGDAVIERGVGPINFVA
jgi:hypothetical protein